METDLTKFEPLKAEMAKLKILNDKLVFAYDTPKGNKDARSHIYKLRQTKAKVVDVHKIAKADALAACQLVDSQKNELFADIQGMIDLHMKPIKEIEDRKAKQEVDRLAKLEAERIAEEDRRRKEVEEREAEVACKEAELRAEGVRIEIARREAEEIRAQAEKEAKKAEEARVWAEKEAAEAVKRAEAAEIARIKAEAESKQKALEAAEQARKDAEQKAADAKQVIIDAEVRAKEEAELKRIRGETAKREKDEVDRALEAERVENEEHREEVERCLVDQLDVHTGSMAISISILDAIKDGEIENVTINY